MALPGSLILKTSGANPLLPPSAVQEKKEFVVVISWVPVFDKVRAERSKLIVSGPSVPWKTNPLIPPAPSRLIVVPTLEKFTTGVEPTSGLLLVSRNVIASVPVG